MTFRCSLLTLIGSVACLASQALADSTTLDVVRSDGSAEQFTIQDLDALRQVTFTTATIWTDGEILFSGVPLSSLMEAVGAKGTTLRLTALNDYGIDMPVADLEEDAPIVATRIDGRTIPVREKGPFWVVYPFDSSPEYRTEVIYSRSVWQLSRLAVLE